MKPWMKVLAVTVLVAAPAMMLGPVIWPPAEAAYRWWSSWGCRRCSSGTSCTCWPDPRPTDTELAYVKKLTQEPSMVEDSDIDALREAGWDEDGIYEATALLQPLYRSSTSVVGWKPHRGCQWTRSRREHGFPKRLLVSQLCQPVL